jgi:hypothetical protein
MMETHKVNDDVTKNGLITDKKGTKYYIDDVMQTGWQSIDVDGDEKADQYGVNVPHKEFAHLIDACAKS